MDDERIEQAIRGVIAVAASNFPSSTDITISTNGKNSASIQIPYFMMAGILETAKAGKSKT